LGIPPCPKPKEIKPTKQAAAVGINLTHVIAHEWIFEALLLCPQIKIK
jgi:hypothetical protein